MLCLTLVTQYEAFGQTEFDLEPTQSMLLTGKGPGQDGANNPFAGQDCYAIVENLGNSEFSVQIQQDGKIIETVSIAGKEERKVTLLKGYELYLDSNAKGKAKVDFEPMAP